MTTTPPPRIPEAARYRRFPRVEVPGHRLACRSGWAEIGDALRHEIATRSADLEGRVVVAVETYPGVNDDVLLNLVGLLRPDRVIRTADAFTSPDTIADLVAPDLTDDPVFGRVSGLTLDRFFSPRTMDRLRLTLGAVRDGVVLVYGVGATLLGAPDLLIYADMARRELVRRFRRDEIANLGADDPDADWSAQYKRAWFVDWRVADRHKQDVFERIDLFLDTHRTDQPTLAPADAVHDGLTRAAHVPWSPVPFFDPAPWGGQWMKEVCGLDEEADNYGWCFNCVPEENSILLDFGGGTIELPSLNVVLFRALPLLGEHVVGTFGAEFPIRFDFLDTMGGGNLSFQVHPDPTYIRDTFRMPYTQDESYYLLDAAPDATVYLGLREGVDAEEMVAALADANAGGAPFDAERFANRWPAQRHDHFLIPAGTVHCSGADCMVLEISATPYLFTFKLWDWGRTGLDGRPRPIHLDHGGRVIRWERGTAWVRENLVDRTERVAHGDGWAEERTGLHELEFIETRRHRFDAAVPHDTGGTVNVLCMVDGPQVVIESPSHAFDPFPLNYAEVVVVPASVGAYTVRPHGPAVGSSCATIKAFVRPPES